MTTEPVNPLEVRMARLEGSYEQINLRLNSLEGQVAEIRSDIRGLRMDLDTRFDKLDRKVEARFNVLAWLSGGLGLVIVLLQVFGALGIF